LVTQELLRKLCPNTPGGKLAMYVEPLNYAIAEFEIAKVREFLAQVAHESGGFIYTCELWGPTGPQIRYDTRADLGNTDPEAIRIAEAHGDKPGHFWRGRGLIQTTGYANFCRARDALGLDCVNHPEFLSAPLHAAQSAGLFWKQNGCDAIADDFEKLTRRINGGLNGFEDRKKYLARLNA